MSNIVLNVLAARVRQE